MNQQNLDYLKNNIKYMGFGDKLNMALENHISAGKPDFKLNFQATVNNKPFEAILNFRKSDTNDMYFFNSYNASLTKSNSEIVEQTFYVNKGTGITGKEAFNLLDGRSVFKELTNKEEQAYTAWVQLDFKNKDKHNNHVVKQYHDNYGYDLAKALTSLPVKELLSDTKRVELIKSLEKGNIQSVTFAQGNEERKMFVEANPQYKTINIYDAQLNRVKREDLQEVLNGKSIPVKEVDKVHSRDQQQEAKQENKQQKVENNKQSKSFAQTKKDNLLPKKKTSSKKGMSL